MMSASAFEFEPQTEEQVLNLWEKGEYDFLVKNAALVKSKKTGQPQIQLTLAIYSKHGEERVITDYLNKGMMFKVKHFCDATGLEEKYAKGTFNAEDCIDRSGKLKLRIEESEGYLPKNGVQDYVKLNSEAPKKADDAPFFDDDINI